MTTTIFLVRHAAHDLLGRVLTGRMAGVNLGPEGRRQAEALAQRLAREEVAAVYSSPLERARETAAPIAARFGFAAEVRGAITELEYGEWSGRSFDELAVDPRWSDWNSARATTRPPGGETMLDVQWRAVGEVERAVGAHPQAGIVMVSHADVIKAMLAYYLGVAIDGIARFEISPASVSTVLIGAWGAKVHSINEVVAA